MVIGGFILGAAADSGTVVIRGLGPSLASEGVTGALSDPTLELHDSNGSVVYFDDNWKDTQRAQIEATNLAPTNDSEATIFAQLASGAYTAILAGKNDATGVGLIEIYNPP